MNLTYIKHRDMLQTRIQPKAPIYNNSILDKALNPETTTIYAEDTCHLKCRYNTNSASNYVKYGYAE